jgi:hypothetical protein
MICSGKRFAKIVFRTFSDLNFYSANTHTETSSSSRVRALWKERKERKERKEKHAREHWKRSACNHTEKEKILPELTHFVALWRVLDGK